MRIAIRNSAGGIGDAICGAYVAEGIKRAYPNAEVVYYTHTPDWISDVVGVEIKPHNHFFLEKEKVYDLNHDYNDQLKKSTTRKDWYAKAVPLSFSPEKPKLKRKYEPLKAEGYVVLAPYSHWKLRDWDIDKWALLEEKLNRKGYKTIVIGSGADKDGKRHNYDMFKSRKIINHSPADVIDLILKATCLIGNDSGMPHLSGMYGVPTFAISAQVNTDRLFSLTSVRGIMPVGWSCIDCGFGRRKPNHTICNRVCSALQSVSIKQVEEEIFGAFRVGGAIVEGKVRIERN